jgi:hypothetical protein
MDKISLYLASLGRKGGAARAKTMTAEQRSKSARKASLARWADKKPAASAKAAPARKRKSGD